MECTGSPPELVSDSVKDTNMRLSLSCLSSICGQDSVQWLGFPLCDSVVASDHSHS